MTEYLSYTTGVDENNQMWIECKVCERRSFNDHDIIERYCSRCAVYHNVREFPPSLENDLCPVCGGKAISQCGCSLEHRECEQKHLWYWEEDTKVLEHEERAFNSTMDAYELLGKTIEEFDFGGPVTAEHIENFMNRMRNKLNDEPDDIQQSKTDVQIDALTSIHDRVNELNEIMADQISQKGLETDDLLRGILGNIKLSNELGILFGTILIDTKDVLNEISGLLQLRDATDTLDAAHALQRQRNETRMQKLEEQLDEIEKIRKDKEGE